MSIKSVGTQLDPVTSEVLNHAFREIVEEMAVLEHRSSFSPVIRDMLDYCCAVFDGSGRLVASSDTIPAQLGLMHFALTEILEGFAGEIVDGDVFICNHPYYGGSHTPDVQIFRPVWVEGELAAITGSIAHHIDVGGRVPGTRSVMNRDLFQEGLLMPPVKIVEAGRPQRSVWRLLESNVRDPRSTLGDLEAQIGACRRGAERLLELVEKFGAGSVKTGMTEVISQTARRTEAEFRSWPEVPVTAEGYLDDDGITEGKAIRIAVKLQVRDGSLELDFAGTDGQVESALNSPWASTHASAFFAVRSYLSSDLPVNHGFIASITVKAPEGSIVRPRFPAPVSARHLTEQRVAEVISRALASLVPERAVASGHVSFPSIVMRAVDPRTGRETMLSDMVGGGGGARPDGDGDDGIDSYTSNCALLPAETAELAYPWQLERVELVEGSGGRGRFRGGMAIRRDYRLLAERADVTFYLEQHTEVAASPGMKGGGPGGLSRVMIRRSGQTEWQEQRLCKGEVTLAEGDTISFQSAGGGGYGESSEER